MIKLTNKQIIVIILILVFLYFYIFHNEPVGVKIPEIITGGGNIEKLEIDKLVELFSTFKA